MRKLRWELPAFAPPFQSLSDPLEITGFRAWTLREPDSGRRYTIVRLTARGGVSGYGEGAPAKAEDLAAAQKAIVGQRATALEFVRARFAAAPAVEAAVSNAMLDVMAASAKVPLYQYLGGPTRFKARLMARLDGAEEAQYTGPLQRAMDSGYQVFTLPLPPRQPMTRLQAYVDHVRQLFASMKQKAGGSAEIVLDGGGALLPGDAAVLARALEQEHPVWFDEPTAVQTRDALSRITDESVLPVGLGRHVHEPAVFQDLLRSGCVDVLRPSLGLNSLHKIRRMAAIAETHYIAVAPYHDGGPLATLFGIHLAASLPNFFIQQVPVPISDRDSAMRAEILGPGVEKASGGFAPLINQPGLGLRPNEQALSKYSEVTA